jgi:hypothetical protein
MRLWLPAFGKVATPPRWHSFDLDRTGAGAGQYGSDGTVIVVAVIVMRALERMFQREILRARLGVAAEASPAAPSP